MATKSQSDVYWQPALGADGTVSGLDDIAQCLYIILNTPKGSDPLRPDFACDICKYIDWPQNRSVPFIVREARAGILKFEPRIRDVRFAITHVVGGVEIVVDWLPVDGVWQQTLVPVRKVQ